MNWGNFKLIFDRWRNYGSTAQFIMVSIMFIIQTGIDWRYLVGGLVLSVIGMAFDWKIIYPSEQDSGTKKNPEWNRRWEEVNRKLDTLLEDK